MADIPGEKELKAAKRRALDFANALDRVSGKTKTFEGAMKDAVASADDLANQLEKLANKTDRTVKEQERFSQLSREIEKTASSAQVLTGVLKDKLGYAFDQLGKKIIKTWANLANSGIDKLEVGIRRVYELQEKWTAAMGAFRTRMGAASQSMTAASKIARQWEGTMHGLTGQFGRGIPMVAEFAEGLQRAITDGDKQMTMFGLKVGQTFGLTAQSTAEMTRSMENMGATFTDQKKVWGNIADQADKAGLNLAQFSHELVQGREFMVRFGKAGAKAFVESAAYVRRLGVSLKSLEGFYDLTDTFEGSTKAAARLNTVFGTTINSLDMMLEQNPAKRFEMVRQQLISQGKTVGNLMPQEIKLISETIGLTTDETNAMLKSGKTFEQYQKEKAKSVDVEKRVHDAMNKTALTMFSFSQAADKITVAIANAISPFLKLIGLAGKGDKDFKSFSEVMGSITQRIVDFFNSLAKNKDWSDFMKKAATTTKEYALKIADYFSPKNIDSTIGRLVDIFKSVWSWSKKILIVWAGFKAVQFFGGAIAAFDRIRKLQSELAGAKAFGMQNRDGLGGNSWMGGAMQNGVLQPGSQGPGAFSRFQNKMGGGRKGAAIGLAGGAAAGLAGYMSGEMNVSQAVGTAIGAALGGAIAGPVGAAVGGWLGEKGGGIIQKVIEDLGKSPEQKKLDEAQRKKLDQQKSLSDSEAKLAELQGTKDTMEAGATIQKQMLETLQDSLEKAKTQFTKLSNEAGSNGGYKTYGEYIKAIQQQKASIDSLTNQYEDAQKTYATMQEKVTKAQIESLQATQRETFARQASALMMKLETSAEYKAALSKASGLAGGDSMKAQQLALSSLAGGDGAAALVAKQIMDLNSVPRMASGGIVSRPTRAIIGESGPEAVIPLRAMARGQVRNPRQFGGDEARRLVRAAGGGGSGGDRTIVIQGGDVVLDGRKVGRQLTRSLIVDVGE